MFFRHVGEMLESKISPIISSSIGNIIAAITPVITVGVIIYLLITGYMIIAGRIQEPIGDIMIKGVKIVIVATLALNANTITTTIIGGINGIETMFIEALGGKKDTYTVLDDSLRNSITIAADLLIYGNSRFNGISNFFNIISVWASFIIIVASSLLITLLGGAIYIMAKVSLAVIFAFSPFFLAGLFFPVTARWFDSWLSQAMNYTLTGAIVSFFISITTFGFETIVSQIETAIRDGSTFPTIMLIFLLGYSVLMFFVTKQAASIASGLAGGIGVSGVSLVGMMVGAKQLASYGMSPFKAVNNAINPVSTRTDSSGQTHTTSRLNHLAHGRTMFRTAHRNAAIDRLALSDRRKGQAKAATHAVMHPVQAIRNAKNNEISNNSMPRTR